jgi:carbon storage regulator
MLVLTRRVGEEIVINGDIRITVTGCQGGRVRIGITAADSIRVDRREVHERRSEFSDCVRQTRVVAAIDRQRPLRVTKSHAIKDLLKGDGDAKEGRSD